MTCTKENYDDLSSHIKKCKIEECVLDNTTVNNQAPQEVGSTGDLGLGNTPKDANLSLQCYIMWRHSLGTGVIPVTLKEATITSIHKRGDRSHA